MTRFYIVRHGETHANREGRSAGHYDTKLTDLGKEQARLTGEALSSVRFDRAYSSDLSRAFETAQLILDGRLEVEQRTELREMNVGAWENQSVAQLDEKYPEERAVWHNSFGICRPTGGESGPEVSERIVGAIRALAKENEGKTVLVVSHGGAMHFLINYARGVALEDIKKEGMPGNASITVMDVEGERLELVRVNDDAHLGKLATKLPKNI